MKNAILALITLAGAVAAAQTLPATAQSTSSQSDLSDPRSAFAPEGRRAAWHADVERTERGFLIGNPDAEASLIEFVSYTSEAGAAFAREGEGALDLALLAPGHMSVEVRPVIRNAMDLTIAMLVQCGGTEDFKDRHRMFLMRQDRWMELVERAPQSQRSIWERGTRTARLNIARTLDFDDMLAARGASRANINRCLSDDRAAAQLIANSDESSAEFDLTRTPSFVLDGVFLTGVHDWATLYPIVAERFRPGPAQQ